MEIAERIAVMEGALSDFDLMNVLQVVSIGRQYTGVELRHADNSPAGIIYVKGGKIVSASARGLRGKEALFQLLAEKGVTFFRVFRTMQPPSFLPEPLGAVARLLLEAQARDDDDAMELDVAGSPRTDTVGRPIVSTALGIDPTPPPVHQVASSSRTTGATRTSDSSSPRTGDGDTPTGSAPRRPTTSPSDAGPRATSATSTEPAPRVVVSATPDPGGTASPRTTPSPSEDAPSGAPRSRGGGDGTGSPAPRPDETERGVIVAVASPKGGVGKTTAVLNLAISLARQGRRVVVVDGDINGDILSALDARGHADYGAFDALLGTADVADALLTTSLDNLRILPSVGAKIPDAAIMFADHSAAWRDVLHTAAKVADVVLVDTPAGMYGVTHQILAASDRVIGVLQAEVLAGRSFGMFQHGLDQLEADHRPRVLGVLLNMLQASQPASVTVLSDHGARLPRGWLFDTALPKNPAFVDATLEGTPLQFVDEEAPPAVSFLFDSLAEEVTNRLALPSQTRRRKPRRLLV